MRALISLFLLMSFSQFGHTDTDEYSVSIGYSADFCDVTSPEICITHFDELTNSLFKKWGNGIPYNYFDDDYSDAINVICAELAGDFHLGYARQLTDKSSLLFDLAF